MFYFAEVDPLTLTDAEIELLDVGILAQLAGSAVEHHATILEDISVVGITQRNIGVLLGQQEGTPSSWLRRATFSNISSTS